MGDEQPKEMPPLVVVSVGLAAALANLPALLAAFGIAWPVKDS